MVDAYEQSEATVALSTGMNPIKNIRGVLSGKIYGQERQLSSLPKLKFVVLETCDIFSTDFISDHVHAHCCKCFK